MKDMDPSFTKEEVVLSVKRFDEAHPARNAYLKETWDFIYEYGYAETLWGRKRWFPGAWSKQTENKEDALRQAANMRIQGTAGDLLKMAMVTIHWEIVKRGLRSGLLFPVHDEVVLEVAEDKVEEVASIVRAAFDGYFSEVDMVLEVFVGKRWGERVFVPQ